MAATDVPLTIGLLRLSDTAPVIVAHEKGYFAARGLDVRLSVEPSWANIADKLTWGRLQAAVLLPPLALAIRLGARGAARRLMVPMTLSLGGNNITLATPLADQMQLTPGLPSSGLPSSGLPSSGLPPLEIGARLRQVIASGWRLRLGVVHTHSSHNLLLRYWLAACGIDLARDLLFEVIPPAELPAALAAGQIEGFCAGAPWGAVAEQAGVGRTALTTLDIWPLHPEKCLAVDEQWAESHPQALDRLLDAVLAGALYCDDPAHADEVAGILAGERYLALDAALIRPSMPALLSAPASFLARSSFHAHGANLPQVDHAGWMLDQMIRWAYLPADVDRAAALAAYRPELYLRAAARAGLSGAPGKNDDILCDGNPAKA